MLQRELIRSVFAVSVGVLVGFLLYMRNDMSGRILIAAPVYGLGLFYAGKIWLSLIGKVISTYLRAQFMSFMTHPILGTILCLLLLTLGLGIVLSFGWIIGIGKWILALVTAYQEDKSIFG